MRRTAQQINGREAETATLLFGLSVKGWRAWRRFPPTSSQSLDGFGENYASLKLWQG
jgi:hypothetical protein